MEGGLALARPAGDREYAKGIKEGDNYVNLPPVICINIIGFEFMETKNLHSVFHLREDRENNIVLTDVLEIHFIDMVKWKRLREKDIANDPLHRWLAYLDRTSPTQLVEEVIHMDSSIMAANDRQVYVSGDEEAIRAYEMRELAQIDWDSSIDYAHREGKIEVARNALAEGATLEFVQKITGLDLQTIKKLR